MTARVAGSTHSVLLAMNVILVKGCDESNSPTPWKFTFLPDWNFFEQLRRHKKATKNAFYKMLQTNLGVSCAGINAKKKKITHLRGHS